jgi:hypothetical protein
MTPAQKRYFQSELGQEARRRASAKQEEKRSQYVAHKREEIERYRESLSGLTQAEVREKMRLFKSYIKLREEQARARRIESSRYWREQRTKEQLEAKMRAERSRVDKLIERGIIMLMKPDEKAEWIDNCRRLNPIMYEVLKEKGVV